MTSRVAGSVVAVLVLASACKLQREQQSNGAIAQSGAPQSALASAAVRAPAQLSAPAVSASAASSVGVLARQETSLKNVTAEVLELRRHGSTLNARVRFVNQGSDVVEPVVTYGDAYLMDATTRKKYEVLKDESNRYIAALRPGFADRWYERIAPGEAQTLWIKFPAPPAEVTTLTLVLPKVTPFEDLAIQR
jgi:hypothetical protein